MNKSDIAVRVEGLGKMYRLGHEIPPENTLGGKLRRVAASPFDWLASQMRAPTEEEVLWALKDVSFEIKRGEVVGFIGHNGAGKSTLLKILSRITEPTTGHAEIHGRIAALLEVGTGMHPELSGRENIYMNGTVLGMKKREIDRKFDEIIEFSGVKKFLDTPVKRYSSGMRVRLGFAIAAHLEPEILVVDEVLAVGDADFQKRCLGKMKDVASGGRTVLFVSHKMSAVQNLCDRSILLDDGRVAFDGQTGLVVSEYLSRIQHEDLESIENCELRKGSGDVTFADFHIEDPAGQVISTVSTGDNVHFVFKIKINRRGIKKIDLGFSIHTDLGDTLSFLYSSFQDKYWDFPEEGYQHVRCTIRDFSFAPGSLLIKGRLLVHGIEADWPRTPLARINVDAGDFYGTGRDTDNANVPFLIKGAWQ